MLSRDGRRGSGTVLNHSQDVVAIHVLFSSCGITQVGATCLAIEDLYLWRNCLPEKWMWSGPFCQTSSGCTIDAPYAEATFFPIQTPSTPTLSSEAKMGVFNPLSVPSQLIFLLWEFSVISAIQVVMMVKARGVLLTGTSLWPACAGGPGRCNTLAGADRRAPHQAAGSGAGPHRELLCCPAAHLHWV